MRRMIFCEDFDRAELGGAGDAVQNAMINPGGFRLWTKQAKMVSSWL